MSLACLFAQLRLRVVRNSGHGPCPSHTSLCALSATLFTPDAPEPLSPDRPTAIWTLATAHAPHTRTTTFARRPQLWPRPMPLPHFSLRVVRNLVYSRRPRAPIARSPDRLRAVAPERPYARAIRSPATGVVRSLGSRLTPRGPDAPIARAPHRAPDHPYARGPRRPDVQTPITRVQGTGTGRLMRRLVAVRAGENPAGMTARRC